MAAISRMTPQHVTSLPEVETIVDIENFRVMLLEEMQRLWNEAMNFRESGLQNKPMKRILTGNPPQPLMEKDASQAYDVTYFPKNHVENKGTWLKLVYYVKSLQDNGSTHFANSNLLPIVIRCLAAKAITNSQDPQFQRKVLEYSSQALKSREIIWDRFYDATEAWIKLAENTPEEVKKHGEMFRLWVENTLRSVTPIIKWDQLLKLKRIQNFLSTQCITPTPILNRLIDLHSSYINLLPIKLKEIVVTILMNNNSHNTAYMLKIDMRGYGR